MLYCCKLYIIYNSALKFIKKGNEVFASIPIRNIFDKFGKFLYIPLMSNRFVDPILSYSYPTVKNITNPE